MALVKYLDERQYVKNRCIPFNNRGTTFFIVEICFEKIT
jgi:hypothetical protein